MSKKNNKEWQEIMPIGIRFGELYNIINQLRGDVPFGTWVKVACKEKIEREKAKTLRK